MTAAPKPERLTPLDTVPLAAAVQKRLNDAIPTVVTDEMREAVGEFKAEPSDEVALAYAVLHSSQGLIDHAEAVLAEFHDVRNTYMLSLVLYDNVPAKQVADACGTTRASMFKIISRTMVGEKAWLRKRPAGAVPPSWRASDYTYDQRVQKARSRGVKRLTLEGARGGLASVAPLVWEAQRVLEEAVKHRDPAIRVLVNGYVLTQDEVAQVVHRNPSRVSHIVAGKGRGATAA